MCVQPRITILLGLKQQGLRRFVSASRECFLGLRWKKAADQLPSRTTAELNFRNIGFYLTVIAIASKNQRIAFEGSPQDPSHSLQMPNHVNVDRYRKLTHWTLVAPFPLWPLRLLHIKFLISRL